jgi:arylsulfatase A-like enzyme
MSEHKKRRRIILRSTIIPFIGLAGFYLFRPLTSPEFAIDFDESKISSKEEFLSEEVAATDSVQRPNVIIIMADDLGKAEVSAYGQQRVETPHIDAIASNGVLFNEGYITSPICSPSRAGLITGRYQQRFGYELQPHDQYPQHMLQFLAFKYLMDTDNWVVSDDYIAYPEEEEIKRQGLPPSEITIAELAKKYDYNTAVIGKWHLGFDDFSYPLQRGFDYHYGFYEAFSLYAYEDDPSIVNHHHDWLFVDKYIWGPGRSGSCAIRRNNEVVIEKEYLTSKFAREATTFIEENKDNPFLLYVPFNAPHSPYQAPKSYYDKFSHIEDENKRVYYAMIKALDDAVGEITGKVEQLGLSENTMIFFLSDNGGATYERATDNYPLKGGKITNFEGGLNIPFMMQWKGTVRPNQVYDHPVMSTDIYATFAAAAGIQLPNDRIIDGVNLIAHLNKETPSVAHKALFWRSGYNSAIRKGKWKLIVNKKDGVDRLYNLLQDKSEKFNVIDEHPAIVAELRQDLENWSKTLNEPKWPKIMDWQYQDEDEVINFAM